MSGELKRQRIKGLIEAGGAADEMVSSDCPRARMRRRLQKAVAAVTLVALALGLITWGWAGQ